MQDRQVLELIIIGVLAALPISSLLRNRSGQIEPLRISFARLFLAYAIFFSVLVLMTQFRGMTGMLGVTALVYGFLGTKRGVGPFYRFAFGRPAIERYPHVIAVDADRQHLLMFITAVICIAAGLFLRVGGLG